MWDVSRASYTASVWKLTRSWASASNLPDREIALEHSVNPVLLASAFNGALVRWHEQCAFASTRYGAVASKIGLLRFLCWCEVSLKSNADQ